MPERVAELLCGLYQGSSNSAHAELRQVPRQERLPMHDRGAASLLTREGS